MKREHDTEPGPPDTTDETAPPSESKPRQITARGLGSPVAASSSTAADTDPGDFVNDSMDRALDAIGNRRRRVPVSLEEGRSEHAPLRAPPSGNDTLPMVGKVVVDTLTDPSAPPPEAVVAPTTSATPRRRTLRPAIVLALAAITVGLLLCLVFLLTRSDGERVKPSTSVAAPSSTAAGTPSAAIVVPPVPSVVVPSASATAPPTSSAPPRATSPSRAPERTPPPSKPTTDKPQDPPASPWMKQTPL